MLKKLIIGILALTVIGAAGAAFVYQVNSQGAGTEPAASIPVLNPDTPAAATQNETHTTSQEALPQNQNSTAAQEESAEPWQAAGTIAELDDYGMTLNLDSGGSVYVELGPPEYWQAQEFVLEIGQGVTVEGAMIDSMAHAYQIQLADGQVLALRTESGQPMWSGGVSPDRGQGSGQTDGEHTPDPKVLVDEWVTIRGSLISFQGGNMTMSTPEGELVSFQSGQPRFFAEQGVAFQAGDEIEVVGFYNNGQFTAGDITQVSTGLRVMLRDPNGRPLWAGPGNSNGNGGNGNGGGGNGGGQH